MYSQDITSRNIRSKFTITYVTVDKNNIQYWSTPSDSLPLKSFKTVHLKWRCDSLSIPCNPTQYIKEMDDISFDAKQNLLKTVIDLISQTPLNNPLVCFVLEFQDPLVKSVRSELLCGLSIKSAPIMQIALEKAFY